MGPTLFIKCLRHWKVFGAALVSVLLIVGAVYLSRDGLVPTASASSEEELLKTLATKDSDRDGLPDWEESLYGTDPQKADSNGLGMTDGEAVRAGLIVPKAIADISNTPGGVSGTNPYDPSLPAPPAEGTLTAAFTQEFLLRYVEAKEENGREPLTPLQIKAIADETIAVLATVVVRAPDFKSLKDLSITDSSPEAMLEYAKKAEAAMKAHAGTARAGELAYLKRALEGTEPEDALVQLASIAKTYRETAAGLAAIPVPGTLAPHHLAIVNTLMRSSEISNDFARVSSDPLAAMLGLQQYPDTALAIGEAFIAIGNTYRDAGITLTADTPGASFVNLMVDLAAKQAAQAAPAP